MIIKAKLQIDPQRPKLSFAQHRLYRRRMGHGAGFLTLGLTAGLALIGLMSVWPDISLPFWLIMTVLFYSGCAVGCYLRGVRSGRLQDKAQDHRRKNRGQFLWSTGARRRCFGARRRQVLGAWHVLPQPRRPGVFGRRPIRQ